MKELNTEQRVFIVALGLLVWVGTMVRWWKWHLLLTLCKYYMIR